MTLWLPLKSRFSWKGKLGEFYCRRSDTQIRTERVVFILLPFVVAMQYPRAEHCHKVTGLLQVFQLIFSISLPCMIRGDFRLFPEIKLKLDVQLVLF